MSDFLRPPDLVPDCKTARKYVQSDRYRRRRSAVTEVSFSDLTQELKTFHRLKCHLPTEIWVRK